MSIAQDAERTPASAHPSATDVAGSPASTEPPPGSRRTDLLVAITALALAGLVTGGLWLEPNHRAITINSGDQAFFEWLLAYGAHALVDGANPLFTYLINVPDGVNLAVNTSITVYALVFAPLTLVAGPAITFVVILTLNLTGTAYAWYWLFSRRLGIGPAAAALGGVFCGFAPGLVSHANAHLNWTAGWLAPLIVAGVLRLAEARPIRRGIALGTLVAAAFSIAAEGLFFTALACGVFLACWALARVNRARARSAAPALLRGLGVTALVAVALLAYPLWLHFLGPQRYAGTGFDARIHSEDIAAYAAFPARSLAGIAGLDSTLAPNPTEENSFFGLPLLMLVAACFALLWRGANAGQRATLRALAITAAVFTVLSFGPVVKWFGHITEVPLPFAALARLPVFDAALPSRLALVTAPIIGLVLAMAADRLTTARPRGRQPGRAAATAWCAGFAAALLPLVPAPLHTRELEPVPRFITSGAWREFVRPGGVLAPVPPTSDQLPDGQRWQAYALASRQGSFRIPAGFFLGPGGPNGRGRIGPVPRPSAALLTEVAQTGVVPPITDADRKAARDDLRYWRAEAVVLADRVHGAKFPVHTGALLLATTDLLGSPERVDDVWVWRS